MMTKPEKPLTAQETLALREFLKGIQSVDNSDAVSDAVARLDQVTEAEGLARAPKSQIDAGDEVPWNQIFDLGEALDKIGHPSKE